MKLARQMGCTVDELDRRMSGDEFAEHMADMMLEELDDDRQDIRTAAIMETIARSQGGKLTRRQAYNSIVPRRAAVAEPEMTEEQLIGVLRMWG